MRRRLPDETIRKGILHPERSVRNLAIRYFAESYCRDRTIMPRVIQAIEAYGRWHAYSPHVTVKDLVQTDESIRWLITELGRIPKAGRGVWRHHYRRELSQALAAADTELLERYADGILGAVDAKAIRSVSLRVQLIEVGVAECWRRLEAWCDGEKGRDCVTDVDLNLPSALCEAIARNGQGSVPRVLAILREKIDVHEDNRQGWLEGFAVRLAGLMRLQEAVPLLVGKLHVEGDWRNGECVEALIRIGGDQVIDAVARDFPDGDRDFRIVASEVLEKVHTDRAVEVALDLLRREEDASIASCLAEALLVNVAAEAVEPVRRMILDCDYDARLVDLREELVAACRLLEVTFPEFDAWAGELKRKTERETAEADRQDARTAEDIDASSADVDGGEEAILLPFDLAGALRRNGLRVHSHDSCPCGSGRRYMNCCMQRRHG